MTTTFDLYFLCVLTSKDAKKAKSSCLVISNKDLNKILKGLTVDELKGFNDAQIYVFFDDRSNVFANFNLTSYVEIDLSNKTMIDLTDDKTATFSGKRLTRVLTVKADTAKIECACV